jgi:hypothetical protein
MEHGSPGTIGNQDPSPFQFFNYLAHRPKLKYLGLRTIKIGTKELVYEVGSADWENSCLAGIGMGSEASGGFVEDPDWWVRESLDYLAGIMPYLEK